MTDTNLVDFEKLESFFSEDEEILHGFLEKFSESYEDMLSNIKKAIDASDPKALGEASHEYKGTVANIFCQKIIDQSLELEQIGKSGVVNEKASEIYKTIESDSKAMVDEIKNYLKTK